MSYKLYAMVSDNTIVYVGISSELWRFKGRANWATNYNYRDNNEILVISTHETKVDALQSRNDFLSSSDRLPLASGFNGLNHRKTTKRIISSKMKSLRKSIKDGTFKHRSVINKTTNTFYKTLTDAKKSIELLNPNKKIVISNITQCCDGLRKTAYGCVWEWAK